MDTGHYNCRDYYISPHFSPTTVSNIITTRSPFTRHESWEELEQRSRSPLKKSFPLLKLPLELRQQIFSYLVPRTLEHKPSNPLADHARNFSAVKKRAARGMVVPTSDPPQRNPTNIVWKKGNVKLLQVCKQIHDEYAEMLYGENTFLLFLTYSGITFRFSWLLGSGGAPNRRYDFLELLPKKYLPLIKRVVVNVDHVDSYTGMIKFNVSGKGLTQGLKKQVSRLVNALQPPDSRPDDQDEDDRRLAKVSIRVSNGNAYLDQIKSDIVRQREGGIKVNEDLEEMLEPFGYLRGVREVSVTGAVTDKFARNLEAKMTSLEKPSQDELLARGMQNLDLPLSLTTPPQLCVYGNDMA